MRPELRLCISTNWDDKLIDEFSAISDRMSDGRIFELFSALPESFVGSGRPAWAIGNVDKDRVRSHIKYARSKGFHFNYLLNGSCMGNREFTKDGFDQLYEYLDFVNSLQVEFVTVSVPF